MFVFKLCGFPIKIFFKTNKKNEESRWVLVVRFFKFRFDKLQARRLEHHAACVTICVTPFSYGRGDQPCLLLLP